MPDSDYPITTAEIDGTRKRFLAYYAYKQTVNYDRQCSDHHPSISTRI